MDNNKLFEQRQDQFGHLPAQILFDLARNEAATREWRKAAVEFLLDRNATQASHPELAALVMEIKAERVAKREVEAVVESAVEGELETEFHVPSVPATLPPHSGETLKVAGPFSASITTASLTGDDEISN